MQCSSGGHSEDTDRTLDGLLRTVASDAAAPSTGRTIDVQEISGDLIARFGAVLTVEAIERCVTAAALGFEDARIDAYLPVLVHAAARRELERMAREASWTANR